MPPADGLWAVEPHIARDGIGVKWEELLVDPRRRRVLARTLAARDLTARTRRRRATCETRPMETFVAAPAGFLLAVLWFDLMFDVQVRRDRDRTRRARVDLHLLPARRPPMRGR